MRKRWIASFALSLGFLTGTRAGRGRPVASISQTNDSGRRRRRRSAAQ